MNALLLHHDRLDLAYFIKGIYHIFDFISDQDSGGLEEYPSQIHTLIL